MIKWIDINSISLISSYLISKPNNQIMGNVRATALPLQRPRLCNSVVYYQIQIFIFLLRMKKQSWKLSLCMPTVRLYAISQLRTVDNCCMLTSPLATCVFAVTLPKSLQRILPGEIHVCITGIKSLGCSISNQKWSNVNILICRDHRKPNNQQLGAQHSFPFCNLDSSISTTTSWLLFDFP